MVVKIAPDSSLFTQADAAFHAVFQSADPFGEPFQAGIAQRLILYPIGYVLNDDDAWEALAYAAAALGETQAFVSLIEGYQGRNFQTFDHWAIDLQHQPYDELRPLGFIPIMENATYSRTGTWGILTSHESHAVLGGPGRFIETFEERIKDTELGDPEHQVEEFVATCKYYHERSSGSSLDWLPGLLRHIYGGQKAKQLLLRAGLPDGHGRERGAG